MANVIKFSDDYPKLWGQKVARLVHVYILSYYDMHPDLVEYDTKTADGKYYPLPKTTLIQLVFVGDKQIPFCTIRRHTKEKYGYYLSKLNKEFLVEVTE